MDLSRQEYPALLATLEPSDAVSVLHDRVKVITTLNTGIADWLQERRKVEETYIHGLSRLARRPLHDGGAASLGIFQMPWQRIVSGTESLAQSHQLLAQKIETDVETPLRQFATKNREMQGITTIQGNLASIAKEVEHAQRKADKARDKSGRASADRVANAHSGVEDASQQWESQAPYVFEQLQALDEARINHLRDVLTQLQTHEVDQVERNRTTAESCLNALLNVETADEIKTFAARVSGARGSLTRRRSSATATNRPQSASLAPPPTPPAARVGDHAPSQFIGTPSGQDRLTPLEEKSSKKSGLGGLKRMGTMMGRRKSALPPASGAPQEKRKDKSRFPFRRGDSSRSFQEVDSPPTTGTGLTPVASNEPAPSPQRVQSPVARENINGLMDADAITEAPMTNGHENRSINTPITSTQHYAQAPQELSAAPVSPATPPATHDSPIPTLDVHSPSQQDFPSPTAENEEALRNLRIRDQPIAEDEIEAKRAMNNMANQLRLQAQTAGQGRQGSVRGRRDVRNTMFIPNPVEPATVAEPSNIGATAAISTGAAGLVAGTAELASPIRRPDIPSPLPEDHTVSDSTSIHSSHSLPPLVYHPELHEPGLNASIVETVSTTFAAGQVTKSVVVGEVALAYNPNSEFPDAQAETVRLENFQELEKVAANPAFVTPVVSEKGKERAEGDDRTGEYSVTLGAIKRPSPTVAFKYQVHINDSNLSAFSPVLLTPAWQIQDNQASVIIVYALNPAFIRASSASPLTLKSVVITVALDTASGEAGRATNAMMAPTIGASFKRKQSLVVWRLPELVVDSEQKKLLARFITTGPPPRAGNIDAKWEFQGSIGSGLNVSTLAGESSDPFADEGAASETRSWNSVACAKKLVSGRYSVA